MQKRIITYIVLLIIALSGHALWSATGDLVAEPGSTGVTIVGTIATGTWNATAIDISDYTNLAAGTGATLTDDTLSVDLGTSIDISDETNLAVDSNELTLTDDSLGLADHNTARTALGLAIGSDVQAYDATLLSIAALGTAANKGLYTTGVDTWAEFALTAAGRAILDDANAAAQIATLGLDADVATLSLPASTTISTAGAALIDDANAAAQVTTLGFTATSTEVDAVADATGRTQGDTLHADNANSLAWLAKGTDNYVLKMTSTVPNWEDLNDTYYTESEINTALNLKANIAGPTFTGTVAVPSTNFTIGSTTFSETQLSEVNTFFGSTDISAAEAETLTDGSDADALHAHNTYCLESVLGTSIGASLLLDTTTLKASAVLQKYHAIDPSTDVQTMLGSADDAAILFNIGADLAGTDNSTDVTLHASATTGGLSISTQEISNRAATNAQTGYATAAHITAIEVNTAKTIDDTAYNVTSWDANTDAATKNTIRDKFVTVDSAVSSNTTHSGGDGSDHADVASNTAASHTQGTDTTLGTMTADIDMDSTYQVVGLQAPAASGEAIRQTANITETNLTTLTDTSDADALHSHGTLVAAHAILDGSVHTDSVADGVTRGSIIYGNSTPKWDELVLGGANTFLGSDGTDLSYRTKAQVLSSLNVADGADVTGSNPPQAHTIASHDTTATGSNLTSLTDNSVANTLHRHSELVGSDGSPDPALSVDADGNVGIGGSRATKLYIKGGEIMLADSSANQILAFSTVADIVDIQGSYLDAGPYPDLTFTTSGTERIRIEAGGNVGIGTTSPNAPLEVEGVYPGVVGGYSSGLLHVTTSDNSEFSNSVITGHNFFTGNTQLWYLGSTSNANNDIAFINRQNANLKFSTNNTERVRIDSSGNVGIATIPDYRLDILGEIRFGSLAVDQFYTFSNSLNARYDQNSDNAAFWFNYRGYQNGTTRFRDFILGDGKQNTILGVDGSAGKVGILTRTPEHTLSVVGNMSIGNNPPVPTADGTYVLTFGDNVADPTMDTDTGGLYAKDVSGTVEMFAIDEADNETQLTSHAFKLFQPDKKEPYPWSYYASNKMLGKEINVDMAGMVRAVEELSGKKFIHYANIEKVPKDILGGKRKAWKARWIEENTSEIEVSKAGAIEQVKVEIAVIREVTHTDRIWKVVKSYDIRWHLVDGELESYLVPEYEKTTKSVWQLKDGVRLDEDTGIFYAKQIPTDVEAELAADASFTYTFPTWLATRLKEK